MEPQPGGLAECAAVEGICRGRRHDCQVEPKRQQRILLALSIFENPSALGGTVMSRRTWSSWSIRGRRPMGSTLPFTTALPKGSRCRRVDGGETTKALLAKGTTMKNFVRKVWFMRTSGNIKHQKDDRKTWRIWFINVTGKPGKIAWNNDRLAWNNDTNIQIHICRFCFNLL